MTQIGLILRTADSTLIEEHPNGLPSPMARNEMTRHVDIEQANPGPRPSTISGVAVISAEGLLRLDNGRRHETFALGICHEISSMFSPITPVSTSVSSTHKTSQEADKKLGDQRPKPKLRLQSA